MNKRIENIYNNNLNFTNNLILKRRKRNEILVVIVIALFIFIANLFRNSIKDYNFKELLDNQDFSNNSVIFSRSNFNKSIAFHRYYAFSIFDIDSKRNPSDNGLNQMSYNFLFKKNNFLTEICFEKYSLKSKLDIIANGNNEFPLLPYITEDLISKIDYHLNSNIVCFSDNSNILLVKIQNNFHSNRTVENENHSEIRIKYKNISQDLLENKLNIVDLGFNLNKSKLLENLFFFTCNNSSISFDLEKHYCFYFSKKAQEKSLDSNLFAINPKNFKISSVLTSNFCLSKEKNEFGIISYNIPRCLEFVNISAKNLYEDNLTYEIDIFIYDLKNDTMNLFFLNKVKINKETASNYSQTYDTLNSFSILYKNKENTKDEISNLRICQLVKNHNIIDKNIKITGIYLEWNFIRDNDNQEMEENKKICFDKLLSIDI